MTLKVEAKDRCLVRTMNSYIMSCIVLYLTVVAICLSWSEAFSGKPCFCFGGEIRATVTSVQLNAAEDSSDELFDSRESDVTSRRELFRSLALTSSAACLVLTATPSPSLAAAAKLSIGATPQNPVAILGAGGKTGMEVAQACAKDSMYCVTMSRSGRDPFKIVKLKPEIQDYITHYEDGVNVLDKDGMEQALRGVGASAIVYCASASRQGGTAFQVDDEGVGNAAQVAKDLGARLILVSALAIDRPNSKSYQITNTLGGNYQGIMDAKLQGEEKVRSILKDYTIIRPGVLMNGVSRNGAIDMEMNQGDTIGGGLSRDELAGVVVGALQSDKAKGVTVEVYRRSTATPLQPNYSIPSGYEAFATTYDGLFESVLPDSKVPS